MCIQWTETRIVEKNPGILTKVVKGNPCGSDLVFGAWPPKWGAHSGLFVSPSQCSGPSQTITAFLLLLFRVMPSKMSLFEGLMLARLPGHCSKCSEQAWMKLSCGGFYWNPSPPEAMTKQSNPTKSADLTAVISFPQGDVVIHSKLVCLN